MATGRPGRGGRERVYYSQVQDLSKEARNLEGMDGRGSSDHVLDSLGRGSGRSRLQKGLGGKEVDGDDGTDGM